MSPRIMFLRSETNEICGCVAIKINHDTSQITYGYSVLNPHDNFNRKLSREIAVGRMSKRPIAINLAHSSHHLTMHEVSEMVMKNLAFNPDAPNRAMKAAKRWLANTGEV